MEVHLRQLPDPKPLFQFHRFISIQNENGDKLKTLLVHKANLHGFPNGIPDWLETSLGGNRERRDVTAIRSLVHAQVYHPLWDWTLLDM